MNQDQHHDKEAVLLPRHKSQREAFLWVSMVMMILIVVTGWVLIVGKQLAGAVTSAKTGIVRVSEIPGQFRETTEPALAEVSEITELIVDGIRPYTEGVKQRQNVLETVSGIVAGDLIEEGNDPDVEVLPEVSIDSEPIANE